MRRITRVLASGAAIVATASLLSLTPVLQEREGTATPLAVKLASAGTYSPDVDRIIVNSKGVAQNESKDSNRTVYTFPMYALGTGEEIGTITDDVGLTPVPGVVDVITTFRFADGEIVTHAMVSISQDAQKPGWIVVGARPEKDTITKATGAYASRTGRVAVSGVNNVQKFPGEIYQDDFWVIELSK